MAFGNWRDYLRRCESVSLKKYLYVFRPLLAGRWIERQLGQVPMLFAQLVECVLDEADVCAALDELVAPPVEALSRFIETELPLLDESYTSDAFRPLTRTLAVVVVLLTQAKLPVAFRVLYRTVLL